jgi:hypothetical protein
MHQEQEEFSSHPEAGQITLYDLLTLISFLMSVMSVIDALRRERSGVLRYVIGVPLALGIGTLILWLNVSCNQFVWDRFKGRSTRTLNFVALGVLILELVWIGIAATTGIWLASLLIKHVA